MKTSPCRKGHKWGRFKNGACKECSRQANRQRKTRISRLVDMAGQRCGQLVALERVENSRSGQTQWLCQCDCGALKTINAAHLRAGRVVSCGCQRRIGNKMVGAMAAFRTVYRQYRDGANRRNLVFELTEWEALWLTQSLCTYCGAPPSRYSRASSDKKVPYVYTGIDRVDNSRGYALDNCTPCCWDCNVAKRTLSESEFADWVNKVHKHWASRRAS